MIIMARGRKELLLFLICTSDVAVVVVVVLDVMTMTLQKKSGIECGCVIKS
jgi:hypothetical protein